MRLGILGGTFDPIHVAHLFIAEEARVRCGLDRVLFIPNAVSPFKVAADVSAPEHRFEMVRLATAGNPYFGASPIEIERAGPSYTSTTLRTLTDLYPGADLFFITGADAAAEIEEWHEPEVVLRLAKVVAMVRPGFPFASFEDTLALATRERIEFVETVGVDLSATELRRRVRSGLPIRYLTPDPVIEYVERHRLYL